MANAATPTVPNAVGVPTTIGTIISTAALVSADAVVALRKFLPDKWGIVDNSGKFIFTPDTVLSVDLRKEYRISEFPIEEGAFASYDKVVAPYDVRVTFGVGIGGVINLLGQLSYRTQFIAALDAAAGSLNLYTVLTPEQNFYSVNIVHYGYSRRVDQGGKTMIPIDVYLKWVRTSVQTSYTTTQAPSGAAQQNQGNVQSIPEAGSVVPGPGFA